jgi:hypothetical protein
VCSAGHEFESWFKDSSGFDKQAKRGLVACPHCGATKVEKALMAPRLTRSGKGKAPPAGSASEIPSPPNSAESTPAPVALMSPQEQEFRTKLKELREHLTRNSDYVGKQFSDEARKMHYGEIEHRSIYGEASSDDAKALHEEGIEFHPLPVLPEERN